MESGGHFSNGTRYGTGLMELYAGNSSKHNHCAIGEAFHDPFIEQSQ